MSLSKSWVLQINPAIYKFLSKIPRKEASRLLIVIQDLPEDPFTGDIQKMKGEENVWRRRVGAYRMRYELLAEERIIHVFQLERRTSTTY